MVLKTAISQVAATIKNHQVVRYVMTTRMWTRAAKHLIILVLVCLVLVSVKWQFSLYHTPKILSFFKSINRTEREGNQTQIAVGNISGNKSFVDPKLSNVGDDRNRKLEFNLTTHVTKLSDISSSVGEKINRSFYNLTQMFFLSKLSFLAKYKDPRPEYNFTITPWIHKGTNNKHKGSWSLVVYIESANSNILRRQAIRGTWTSKKARKVLNMVRFFIVGSTSDKKVQRDLVHENNRYGDILQLDKEDIYRHITHKSLAAIQWSSTNFPPHWTHAISGDDVFLDVVQFRSEMQRIIALRRRQLENIYSSNDISQESVLKELPIYCTYNFYQNSNVIRDKKNKYYVSRSEYPFDRYPPYCAGPFYALPIRKAATLLEMARYLVYCWMEDAWITGVIRLMVQTENGVLLSESEKNGDVFQIGIKGSSYSSPAIHISELHVNIIDFLRAKWKLTLAHIKAQQDLPTTNYK